MPMRKHPIIDAMAVIRYNPEKENYDLFTLLATGKEADATLQIKEDALIEWWFDTPGGTVKYTIEITENTWTESGKFSPDKQNWYPFIQFTLNRK